MIIKDAPPEFLKSAFNCPHCAVFAQQTWSVGCSIVNKDKGDTSGFAEAQINGEIQDAHNLVADCMLAFCENCKKYSLWIDGKIIYPDISYAPRPNLDLKKDILLDYREAASILSKSPRGAAALLRLCIQNLCKELGESGDNLDKDIAALVKKGLSDKIQKALATLRVIGPSAVLPGLMDIKDNEKIAIVLFGLVNFMAFDRVTKQKEIDRLNKDLTEADKEKT